MTIEELSTRSGVTTRNIRAYQSRALLPAPGARPGERAAFYTADHLTRLRLINRLQSRGFSLAGISDLVSAWSEGKSIEQVLGIESAIASAESAEQAEAVVMSEAELRAGMPPDADPEEVLKKLVAVGFMVPHRKGYRIRQPKLFE